MSRKRVGKNDKRDFEIDSLHITAHGISEKLDVSNHIFNKLNKIPYEEAKNKIIEFLEKNLV